MGTRFTRINGILGSTRWRADSSSPGWRCRDAHATRLRSAKLTEVEHAAKYEPKVRRAPYQATPYPAGVGRYPCHRCWLRRCWPGHRCGTDMAPCSLLEMQADLPWLRLPSRPALEAPRRCRDAVSPSQLTAARPRGRSPQQLIVVAATTAGSGPTAARRHQSRGSRSWSSRAQGVAATLPSSSLPGGVWSPR